MTKYNHTALIVDDEKRITFELQEFFEINDYKTLRAHSIAEERELLQKNHIDILIQDIRLSDGSGLDILIEVKEQFPNIDVIMISGHGDMDTVIEAMRLGATDYLKKPFTHNDLLIALERINSSKLNKEKLAKLSDQKAYILDNIADKYSKHIVSISEKSKKMLSEACRISKFDSVNVLLKGKTGTGKEVLAHFIHNISNRKDNLIVNVNCSAIPETMFESEFFGYEKGAFTGAEKSKQGFFAIADKGTLFLDEIGDMSYNVQSKLLRAIESQEFYPLGSQKPIKVDVRIISATNRDLKTMIQNNEFRGDLYHRLNGFTLTLPILKERKEDIPSLIDNFVQRFSRENKKPLPHIDPVVYEQLSNLNYEGNIRELKNMVEKAMIFCDNNCLTLRSFGIEPQEIADTKLIQKNNLNLNDNEKSLILEALKRSHNNQSKAAKLLGISRHALIRRLAKFNLYSNAPE